jgi:transcriptional regulator with XRE-family HTH domain
MEAALASGAGERAEAALDTAAAVPRVGALIRARRRQAGLTLQALSAAAGVSVPYLSQIERDQATPSLGTLAQVARGLGVGVDYFIAAPKAQDALSRGEGRLRFSVQGSSILYERLSTEFPGSELSSFLMHVPPGYRSEVVSHEGEECLYVLDGEITQWLGAEEIVLRVGDALHFRGTQDHAWANRGARPARMLWTGKLALFQPGSIPTNPTQDKETSN